ncbi:MAG TPA: hypothetical protein VJ964_11590, partial [Balneolaceae bacterium]|nr:hypothetical protein [Balneolaceae bacterium]
VSSVKNISEGDKIRLDIDSKGHGIETVTVKHVGTASARSTFGGPLKENEDKGTGLDLVKPLKYDHASNLPFSVNGTGISFKPATTHPHLSNEPVLPLGTGIKLDKPLAMNHGISTVVYDQMVKTAGYQGPPSPDQWFGGPALSARAGNMVLRDDKGNVVDGLNYGQIVDPWAAEGYQAASGAGEYGCSAPSPSGSRWWLASTINQPNRSAGRYPNGNDSDSNCRDFILQNTTTMSIASAADAKNIKVASVAGFNIGQKIVIGKGANSEMAVIAIVGTAGGTTVDTAITKGATVIPVANVEGFDIGQKISLDKGNNHETAVIASIKNRRRFGQRNGPADSITVTKPLRFSHDAGAQVSGSGITLSKPLTKAHNRGTQVNSNVPTPGEPNQYFRKP